MNTNKVFFTLRTIDICNNEYTENEAFYGFREEDVIEKIKSQNIMEPTFCVIYKTVFKYNETDCNKHVINDIKNKLITNVALFVNNVLTYGKLQHSDDPFYMYDNKKYKIIKILNIVKKNGDVYNKITPFYIICKKNNKTRLYPVNDMNDSLIGNEAIRYLKTANDIMSEYTNPQRIKKEIKKATLHFGVYLLEEYVKDTIQGLPLGISQARTKTLEQKNQEDKQMFETMNMGYEEERTKAITKGTERIEQIKKQLLEVNTKRLEDLVKNQLEKTGIQLAHNKAIEDLQSNKDSEQNTKLENEYKQKLLNLGIGNLTNTIIKVLKEIVPLQIKINREEEKGIKQNKDLEEAKQKLLKVGTERLEDLVKTQLETTGIELARNKLSKELEENQTANQNKIKELNAQYKRKMIESGVNSLEKMVKDTLTELVPLQIKINLNENKITDIGSDNTLTVDSIIGQNDVDIIKLDFSSFPRVKENNPMFKGLNDL